MEEVVEEKQTFRDKISKFLPLIIFAIIALVIGLSMIGNFYRVKIDGEKVFYHLYDIIGQSNVGVRVQIFFIVIYLVLPVIAAILLLFDKVHKNFSTVSLFLLLFSAVVSIVAKDVFASMLSNNLGVDCELDKVYFCGVLPTIGYFVLSIIVLSYSVNKVEFSVRDITESGVLIAIALGLNFIRLFPAPTGGSVNLQMLPLFILALRRGPLKGFIGCGIVYGLISCLTDGWGFAFFPFDYLIGFGSCSFLGFLSPYILNNGKDTYNVKGEIFLFVGGIVATFIRFVGGCISSMFFYSLEFVEAMIYNVGYVFISGGISLAIVMMMYGPLLKVNKRFPAEQ